MGLLNIALDLMTITIATFAIGIGLGKANHYIYPLKADFQKDGSYLATMYHSHACIGLVMLYASITSILGFIILVLSNYSMYLFWRIHRACHTKYGFSQPHLTMQI